MGNVFGLSNRIFLVTPLAPVTMLRSPVGRCPHAQPQEDNNTSRCDKVARSTGIKVVEVQGRRGPRLVEVASVLCPITLQTDGESEIVKVYP